MRASSGIHLPGHASRGLQIFVPGRFADGRDQGGEQQPSMVCRVPTGPGKVCGALFYPGQEGKFLAHMRDCKDRHIAAIHEQSPKSRVPIIHDPNQWDPEAEEHLRKVGQRMIEEGRLVLKRNERIGT